MWIVTKIGFFNLIKYPEDKKDRLLTIKARSQRDLDNFKKYLPASREIEESRDADYRFRFKADQSAAAHCIAALVEEIDYAKTKPVIMKDFPERSGIYYQVWEDLYAIQTTPTKSPR